MKTLTCKQCGDPFTPDSKYACADQLNNVFCSAECLMEYARESPRACLRRFSSRPLDDDDWEYAEEESDD